MDPAPPSLDIADLGDRLRGQLRLHQDPGQFRRLYWSAISAIVLLMAGTMLENTLAMTVVYVAGFLLLVVTAWSLIGIVRLPQPIEVSGSRLLVADDEVPLASIERIDATDGPPALVVVLHDGNRHVWQASADHHTVEDLAWFADQVRRRLVAEPG